MSTQRPWLANYPSGVPAEIDLHEFASVVAVLESMKLFMDLKSPAAGTVARVAAKPGATAAAGELLIAITPA